MSIKIQLAIIALYIMGIIQGVILGVYLKWTVKDTIAFWRGLDSAERGEQ